MLNGSIRVFDVRRELEGNLLEGLGAKPSRDSGTDSLKVEIGAGE